MRYDVGRFRRPMRRSTEGQLMSLISLGDGSTLTLDFTTGVLDPRLTFTRSSTATYIGADGLVKTMAAAPTNDPTKARFDYDPTTLAPRGLLIEGSAVNLLNWSESFATSGGTNNNWADTNITRNSTNNTDPANGTTALRVTASAGNGTIISTAAMGTSAQRTFSIWLRRVSGTGDIQYTLDNGSTYTTQAITSSWVRYTFAATTAAQRVGIRIVTNNDSIELWGAQLETGSGASSYIPTGASQGTRNQDQMQMADLASLGFNTSAGTLTINGTYNKDANSAAYPRSVRFMGSSVQSMAMITSGKTLYGNTPNTSGGSYFEASRTLASAGAFKFGWTLTTAANPALASATVSLNGSSTSITPLGQGAIVSPTSLQFLYGAAAATDYPSMNISSVKYWPYATTAADLNVRTSL